MSNIDKRALLVSKAKASVFTMEYISQFEASDIDSDDVDLRFEVDGVETGTTVSIVDECGHAAQIITALLDELEADKEQIKTLESRNRRLEGIIDAAEKRIAEQSKAASVDSQWKPDVCPITGRRFFMWIEHPSLGYVPTYGGPFDSYTIPTRDSSGEFSCERYDHDVGGWVEGETIGLYLIDDDEQCRVCELEERIAELEARTVNLSKLSVGEVMHLSGFSRDYAEGWCAGNDNAIHEIRAAGIKVKES
ncbi:ead/Ea22-like family protein [Salmonella enterica subsp. enterica]|nr:ead/Ea22-like family protein [Salmonella enterica subsp. enterica serovar Soumbedioune]EEC0861376.1 ead/Ea22-like family protein [Salmonella enterica subsp. enterica serovar Soumbedioune]